MSYEQKRSVKSVEYRKRCFTDREMNCTMSSSKYLELDKEKKKRLKTIVIEEDEMEPVGTTD